MGASDCKLTHGAHAHLALSVCCSWALTSSVPAGRSCWNHGCRWMSATEMRCRGSTVSMRLIRSRHSALTCGRCGACSRAVLQHRECLALIRQHMQQGGRACG